MAGATVASKFDLTKAIMPVGLTDGLARQPTASVADKLERVRQNRTVIEVKHKRRRRVLGELNIAKGRYYSRSRTV